MSKKSAYFFSLIFFVFSAYVAQASQMPRYLGTEKKFRSYIYNPNDVYRYIGHYTYQGFIELEEGETVGTISMGNPTLWLFEHLGNRLFLKPVGEDNSETNMTVITNKRVYHFELVAKEAKSINDKDLIFVAKFVYPDEKDKNIVEFAKSSASDEPDMRDLTLYNFNYQYTGEPLIAPIKVFDNDEFTYFQFVKKNAEVPAIFTVDAGGYESLVNFRSTGSYIIVERVSPQFTLRSGSDIVCVYNTSLYSDGRPKVQTSLKNRKDKNAPPTVDFSTPASNQAPNFSPSSASSFPPSSASSFPPNYESKNSSPNSMQNPSGAPSSFPPGMPAGMPGMMGGAPDDFEMPKTSKMPKLPGDPY